jgi:hypothetical protein
MLTFYFKKTWSGVAYLFEGQPGGIELAVQSFDDGMLLARICLSRSEFLRELFDTVEPRREFGGVF